LAFGIFSSATYVAFSCALSLGTWVYTRCGWRAGYLAFGATSILISAAIPCMLSSSGQGSAGDEETAAQGGRYAQVLQKSEHGAAVTAIASNPLRRGELSSVDDMSTEALPGGGGDGADDCAGASGPAPTAAQAVRLIAVEGWYHRAPYVYCAALAMGLRLGAGFVWSAYTGLFFSPLLVHEAGSPRCAFSYAFSAVGGAGAGAGAGGEGVCGAAYPYCVEGVCSTVSQSPWHNQVRRSPYRPASLVPALF
jgi:hypothetical protein